MTKSNSQYELDYYKINEKYRVGKSPNDIITLYRWDTIDIMNQQIWIFSKALKLEMNDIIQETKKILESNNNTKIIELIEKHTSWYTSPLISLTRSPEMAQSFAKRKDTTIYEIKVKASRLIFDYNDIGCTGNHKEYFVFGKILQWEINAVKIDNSELNSELLFINNNWTNYIKIFPSKIYNNQWVKNPENWKKL